MTAYRTSTLETSQITKLDRTQEIYMSSQAEQIRNAICVTSLKGVVLIANERQRQLNEKGYLAEVDDGHTTGELALVAALYASPEQLYSLSMQDDRSHQEPGRRGLDIEINDPWPAYWPERYDKRAKHTPLRRLVIAGALIAAEIDRLLRLEAKEGS